MTNRVGLCVGIGTQEFEGQETRMLLIASWDDPAFGAVFIAI